LIKKLFMSGCFLTTLSACDQNLSTTLYVRDIQELNIAATDKDIPIDITIEIFETGIDKQCSKPEGKEIIEAIASSFQKANLIGCEKIAGSMKDKMTIKATTRFSYTADGSRPAKHLIEFETYKFNDEYDAVNVRFNQEKYVELQKKLKRINMMANITTEDVNVTIMANNDLREAAELVFSRGVFANGDPIDNEGSIVLEPRQETTIKLGNVKMASLAKYTWARVFAVKRPS